MGKVAEAYSDLVVLTNDNVRTENPLDIIHQISAGMNELTRVYVETDRRIAIRWALENSETDDLIVVAGKGHETSQVIGDNVSCYDERDFIKEIINEAQYKGTA